MKEISKEVKDKRNEEYNLKARKYPAYLSMAVPILLGVAMGVKDMASGCVWLKAVVYVMSISAISTALFFLLRFTLRDISKIYPGMILFCDRLKPTTRLLYSDDTAFTDEKKSDIRKKIKTKKDIDLQKIKVKSYKNKNYVKRVDEAVSWLLDVTRFDDILFEYNCIFGFWRNLSAAFVVDAIIMFCLAVLDKWFIALPFGSFLVIIGFVVLFISVITSIIAYANGLVFAKKVYDVFINLSDDDSNY